MFRKRPPLFRGVRRPPSTQSQPLKRDDLWWWNGGLETENGPEIPLASESRARETDASSTSGIKQRRKEDCATPNPSLRARTSGRQRGASSPSRDASTPRPKLFQTIAGAEAINQSLIADCASIINLGKDDIWPSRAPRKCQSPPRPPRRTRPTGAPNEAHRHHTTRERSIPKRTKALLFTRGTS